MPFGDALLDRKLAQMLCILANANRNPELRKEPFTVYDFAPYLDQGKKEKIINISPEENARLIRQQIEAMRNP